MNFTPVRPLALALLALSLWSAGVPAQFLSDPEEQPEWVEAEAALPPAPDDARLRAFDVGTPSPNHYYVDEGSLSVGADGVLRYTLVVRTPGGAQNVTFEGIRCATAERRIYASGRAGGEWAALKNSKWERISDNTYNRPRAALAFDYFCDGPAPPRSRDEALRLLRTPRERGQPFGVRP